MKRKKRIALFFTGGTIGMECQEEQRGVAPGGNFGRLLDHLSIKTDAQLTPIWWSDLPSPHMTPERMLGLARSVDATLKAGEADAAIVLHGTDLMTESAFMMELVQTSEKPVVFTGSMRHMGESGYDGIRNLQNSIAICLSAPPSPEVLVQMGDWFFTAADAIKEDSLSTVPIVSGQASVAGRVVGSQAVLARPVTVRRARLPFGVESLSPDVHLVSAYPGMDSAMLDFLTRERGAAGIVVEGFGAGNVPPSLCPGIERACAAGAIVVVSTRCIHGGAWPIYGYPGGAEFLQREYGVLLSSTLSGTKALLLLKAALGNRCGKKEIEALFSGEFSRHTPLQGQQES